MAGGIAAAALRRPWPRALPPAGLRPHLLAARAAGSALSGAVADQAASPSHAPRFYVPDRLVAAPRGALLKLSPEESRHAAKTLRLRPGDRVELCDGLGFVAAAEIAGLGRGCATVATLGAPQQVPRTGWQWEVACACGSLKGGRSDWLAEKCAELGAAAFTPLLTHRSPTIGGGGGEEERPGARGARRRTGGGGAAGDDQDGGGGSGREARWERVATAAMKQCLRAHAMPISRPCSTPQLCERVAVADAALVGVAGAPPLAGVAARLAALPPGRGLLCVGPEGDWTAEEVAALVAAGAQPVGLGPLRLRAETAAVALLSYLRLHLPS